MQRILAAILFLVACGGETQQATDGSASDLATSASGDGGTTRCGMPGDTGNSLGVGQYCTAQGPDCPTGGAHALLCSALFNGATPSPDDTYFCSFSCAMTDPPDVCGENATCLCDSRGCACIPTRCIPPDGGA